MYMQPLHPLIPVMHPSYTPHLAEVDALVRKRNIAQEDECDRYDREIVARLWWKALRPDDIARRTMQHWRWRSPLSIDQATLVLAAIAEAGYPIACNGAPEYGSDEVPNTGAPDYLHLYPVRGAKRDEVLWSAARYWAEKASQHLTYVSLGDARGFLPRPVQYDQPGGMNPNQKAALTFGPLADRGDECDSHGYMRRHTRRLILVKA
jgi:hypothetical protein